MITTITGLIEDVLVEVPAADLRSVVQFYSDEIAIVSLSDDRRIAVSVADDGSLVSLLPASQQTIRDLL